ncbi:histone acetylation protein-domain-containing protein [Corynascus novoguineensis]|uniref:histone acetyltransferase n=1 Tax=Corynascus novoguineensis TaxID=1126955 RepID=A0AAN7CNQ3_9PEZI|nr:histone acetylation protein-domain-containing protein [Corynascus novoguineensis]
MASAPKHATGSTGAAGSSSLRDRLAAVLPQGHKFGVHHLSTPPTRAEPLCAAPPGRRPDKTYRESHFLAVSIRPREHAVAGSKRASPGADQAKEPESKKRTLVFALEVFIFTTAYQTTLFVSKADSTGYLHLLDLPEGAPSPIRQVCATFLAYLLDHRRRNHIQSVVNLFARAQAQYLFPGSVKNKGKHVLDDRGLVRWWCKVLNPLMEGLSKEPWAGTRGYLLVPGLEDVETRAFIPRTAASLGNWVIGHPLEQISHYTRDLNGVPPRCLIPGYPDDPKSRFRDELDEEVSKQKQDIGAWRSVKTLDQFWEMMAFRQECSSGRLTGFIWLVFDPIQSPLPSCFKTVTPTNPHTTSTITCNPSISRDMPPTPSRKRVEVSSHIPHLSPLKAPASPSTLASQSSKTRRKKTKKKLSGLVVPRTPKIKTEARSYLTNRPTATAYYYWPPEARGDKLVQETEYKRIVELLLHLDFSTLDKAVGSSRRWLNEVAIGGSAEGGDVVGRASIAALAPANGAAPGTVNGTVTNLTGLIRRKNAPSSADSDAGRTLPPAVKKSAELATEAVPKVNVLGGSIVRKEKKEVGDQ